MKKILLFLVFILGIWIVHGGLLVKVSKNEIEIKAKKKELENFLKELEKKELEYDAIVDLEKIEDEMKKKGMTISKEINFFKIEE